MGDRPAAVLGRLQVGRPNGFLDIFQKGHSFAKQWKYTNAPDADARAVQALYWAKKWADEQGGNAAVDGLAKKAAKLGDYVRYSFFDKYFKTMGCTSPSCPAAKDYRSAHYLISWYYAWGGSRLGRRVGLAHRLQPQPRRLPEPARCLRAGQDPAFKPRRPNGARDWGISLDRQIEFYRWLQAADGGIAGGATNSWKGRYEEPPAGTKTFYGMAYEVAPVYHDPPSNEWFGFQVWSMQRVAQYYYVTGDPRAKVVLDKWVGWAAQYTRLTAAAATRSRRRWRGAAQPGSTGTTRHQNFEGNDKKFNAELRVKVKDSGDDAGVASATARTLAFYAAKSGDKASQQLAKDLLDRMWKFRDKKGVKPRGAQRLQALQRQGLHPAGFQGKMANGDPITAGPPSRACAPSFRGPGLAEGQSLPRRRSRRRPCTIGSGRRPTSRSPTPATAGCFRTTRPPLRR